MQNYFLEDIVRIKDVLIDTYRCLMQNTTVYKATPPVERLNRYISLLNAEPDRSTDKV